MVSKVVISNHEEIDDYKESKATKLLLHYFEVTNNKGYIAGKYEGNKEKLLNELSVLSSSDRLSEDEKLCFLMLQEPLRRKIIKQVSVWDKEETPGCTTHNQMIEMSCRWDNDMLLGQLWLLYRGFIDG